MNLSYTIIILFLLLALSITVNAATIELRPDGDDSCYLETHGSSTHYVNVDDNTNGDLDYNYLDTTDIKSDQYEFEEATEQTGIITQVELRAYVKHTAASSNSQVQFGFHSGAWYWGWNDTFLSSSYTYYSQHLYTHPSGRDWEWSDVTSNLEAGVGATIGSGGTGEVRISSFFIIVHYSEAVELSNPEPTNNSMSNSNSFNWSIYMNDPGDSIFDWNISCSNNQTTSSTTDTDGRKYLTLTNLTYNTTYTIYVNVTNGVLWTREIFYFTTPQVTYNSISFGGSIIVEPPANQPPEISTPSPINQSTGINISTSSISILLSDDNATINYTIQGTYINNKAETSAPGTKTTTLITPLPYNTTIYWFVNVTDIEYTTTAIYHFTTESEPTEVTLSTISTYDFGIIKPNQENTSTELTLTNTGSEDITSIRIKASDVKDVEEFNEWILSSTPGINTYSLRFYDSQISSWRILTESYQSLYSLNINDSETYQLRILTPIVSTYNSQLYGTVTIEYSNLTETKTLEIDILVSTSNTTNDAYITQYNISTHNFLEGGLLGINSFYLPINASFTINTSYTLPNTYTSKSWIFFTSTDPINTFTIFGITSRWDFITIPYEGTTQSFKLKISDINSYISYIIVPNPGYFQSEWWVNTLNNAKDTFINGERLI